MNVYKLVSYFSFLSNLGFAIIAKDANVISYFLIGVLCIVMFLMGVASENDDNGTSI